MKNKKTILFVHPSAGLYGADKTLLYLAKGLDRKCFIPIVLLPQEGALKSALEQSGIDVRILPLVRLERATFNVRGIIKTLFWDVPRSIYAMKRELSGTKIDVVHSNTLAVFSGALLARLCKTPHVWHVHEIINNPVFVLRIYCWMLSFLANQIVFNSNATKANYVCQMSRLNQKSVVVWNGLVHPEYKHAVRSDFCRTSLSIPSGDVVVVLVGRINRWKGQVLLVEALTILWKEGFKNFTGIFVGGPPDGQPVFLMRLEKAISDSPAKEKIRVIEFCENIWDVWSLSDIVVVPSLEPEPFGMVALEAMCASKPVVAAAHGGIIEVVDHENTGILFEPGDAMALASAIRYFANDQKRRHRFGARGCERWQKHFDLQKHLESFEKIYMDMI